MPIQRPLTPIQRPTLQAATAVAVEALVLGALYSLAQSFNIQFQHVGGLQCLQVNLSDLLGGLIVWVFSPLGPEAEFQLADGLGGSHSSPLLVLLQHGSVPFPLQTAPQGGQEVLDSLLPPLRPAGQWAR